MVRRRKVVTSVRFYAYFVFFTNILINFFFVRIQTIEEEITEGEDVSGMTYKT